MPGTTADRVSTASTGISETARAKINLALHVLDRRPDGYHTLDSLVVFADIGDALTVEAQAEPGVTLQVGGDFAGELERATRPQKNFVIAAAEALYAAYPEKPMEGVKLILTKRLPIAAGVGGGSADAAATLRLLNRIWGLGATEARLAEIGLSIGADVPACVHQTPVHVQGVGERLAPVSGLPALPLVLVNPAVPVPTGNVFRRLAAASRAAMPPLPDRFGSIPELAAWLRTTRNDLLEASSAVAPVISEVMKGLTAAPGCLIARISGSGGTAFGIFNTMADAERAAARLRAERKAWWTVATKTGGS